MTKKSSSPHEALWIPSASTPSLQRLSQPPSIDNSSTKRAILLLLLTCLLFLLAFNARLISNVPEDDNQDFGLTIPLIPPDLSSVQKELYAIPTSSSLPPSYNKVSPDPLAPAPVAVIPPSSTTEQQQDQIQQKPPFSDEDDDKVIAAETATDGSTHYAYIVVIASEASYQSRRNLIRSNYFGLHDNLIPCMRYNTDVYYTFWIHGGPPPSNTPERRRYETEKMEWNDMVEMPSDVPFEQETVLEWVNII